MADFVKAYNITVLGNERGYNPGIGEKETYMGIDRGANPAWTGWQIIDKLKAANRQVKVARLNLVLSQNAVLQPKVKWFYKTNYWDVISLDKVNDQQLANNLFDCSVNQGSGLAAKFMQVACNYVITATKSAVKPLTIDHEIGPATLSAFNSFSAAELNAEINNERSLSYRMDAGFAEWGKIWEKRLKQYINNDSDRA